MAGTSREGVRPSNPGNPMTEADAVRMSLTAVHELSRDILVAAGLSEAQAEAIATVLTAGERDECRSHGVYRLAGCVATIRSGKLARDAVPVVSAEDGPVLRVDAGFGFSCLAFETARPLLAERAKRFGLAALAITNCFHFSALWPEVEALAADDLAALAMTPSHSWVAPTGGTKPVFGTNPIAFAWPRPGRNPYVFDFATSEAARGEIELHRQRGKPIPLGWAIDADGKPTTDPEAGMAGAMLPFGGHKGSALSTMVELMAGALLGDMMSFQSQAFDEGAGVAPCHGELIIAFSPDRFGGDAAERDAGAEHLFGMITGQGARLPSQRRYDARRRSESDGVLVSRQQYDILMSLKG